MVFFKSTTSPSGTESLIILNDETQSLKRGTALRVGDPLTGSCAKEWPRLTTSLQLTEWSKECSKLSGKSSKTWSLLGAHHKQSSSATCLPTLGRRIMTSDAKWDDAPLQFFGEFHYVPGYWEWTEDVLSRCKDKLVSSGIYDSVYASLFTYDRNSDIIKAFCEAWSPTTNTLLTSCGELSISLWDLNSIAGLPIRGILYDEVVPSEKELCGQNKKKNQSASLSCQALLHSFHILRATTRNSRVTVEEWIKFWSKKRIQYKLPPPRKEKKSQRPKSTHNPLDDFGRHKAWLPVEDDLFSGLGVRESAKEETFLAAHLACWLCIFVFPVKDVGFIRPATFRMACCLASGTRVGLAIPVLASIYKGLNAISESARPSKETFPFPIHFVYGWLAHYFKTHYLVKGLRGPQMTGYSGEGGAKYYDPSDARKRIHAGDTASWTCNVLEKDKDVFFADKEGVSETERIYFMSIRSCYLTLRLGEVFIVEPYSPHRFSRQFGYYQDVPGVLKYDQREASLAEGLRFWRISSMIGTLSKAWLPSAPSHPKRFYSSDYKTWLFETHMRYLEENIDSLLDPRPCVTIGGGDEDGKEHDISSHENVEVHLHANGEELEGTSPHVEASSVPSGSPVAVKADGLTLTGSSKRKSVSSIPSRPHVVVKADDLMLSESSKGKSASSVPSRPPAAVKADGLPLNDSSKRKSASHNPEDSDSSNADRNWKRVKKNPQSSKREEVDTHDNSSCHLVSHSNFPEKINEDIIPALQSDEQSQGSQESNLCGDTSTKPPHIDEFAQRATSNSVEYNENPPAYSVFQGEKFVHQREKQFLTMLWGDLTERILNTPLEELSSMHDEVQPVLSSMRRIGEIDISHVESSLKSLFEKAATYDRAMSASAEKSSKEALAKQLHDIEGRLHDAKTKRDEESSIITSTEEQILGLKRSIKGMQLMRKNLTNELKCQQESLKAVDDEISKMEEEILTLKDTPLVNDEACEDLEVSRKRLSVAREELRDLKPFA